MKEILTLDETSKMLGVSKSTLRRWDNCGKFKALKTLGGFRRYSINDVNNMLSIMGK